MSERVEECTNTPDCICHFCEEVRQPLKNRIVTLQSILIWLDRKGGLGVDVHNQIRLALGMKPV